MMWARITPSLCRIDRRGADKARYLSVNLDLDEFLAGADLAPHGSSQDDEKDQPWKSLLSMSARCSWRVSDKFPEKTTDSLKNILEDSMRRRKQLRRAHESVLERHRMLQDKKDRERQRVVFGVKMSTEQKDEDASLEPVLYGADECLADFYFRVMPHYAVVSRVLDESRSLLGKSSLQPKRVIDFGIGCGSASAAALHVFGDSIKWIHGIDPSQVMRQGAETFLNSITKDPTNPAPDFRTTFSSHITPESSSSQYDLALFAYTALELPDTAASLAAAALLWEKLQPGGLFVMIEPGTPSGFRSVKTVRSMLIDCGGDTETECEILAPCTHKGKCPMENHELENKVFKAKKRDKTDEDDGGLTLRSGYCSFVQSLPTGGDNEEKFSYIVAHKRKIGEPELHPFAKDDIQSLLHKSLGSSRSPSTLNADASAEENLKHALDLENRFLNSDEDPLGLELIRGKDNRRNFGRIIHAPKKRKGHVLIDSCVAPGALVRTSISKSMSNDAPGVYEASKRSRWGGLWPIIETDEDRV